MAMKSWWAVTYFGGARDGQSTNLDASDIEAFENSDKPYRHGYYLRTVRFPGSLESRMILTQNRDLRGDELKGAL